MEVSVGERKKKGGRGVPGEVREGVLREIRGVGVEAGGREWRDMKGVVEEEGGGQVVLFFERGRGEGKGKG